RGPVHVTRPGRNGMGLSFESIGNWVDKIASSGPSNEDPDPAFRNYHHAIRLKPKDPEAHYQRAMAYVKAGKFARAAADLDQVIQLKPDHVQAYLQRGMAR